MARYLDPKAEIVFKKIFDQSLDKIKKFTGLSQNEIMKLKSLRSCLKTDEKNSQMQTCVQREFHLM